MKRLSRYRCESESDAGSAALGALLLVTASALVGCAGARPNLLFDGLRYPVSMTGTLLDEQGEPVGAIALEDLGPFEWEGKGRAIGYTFYQLNQLDVSEPINHAISEVGGEAIKDLRVIAPTHDCFHSNALALGLNLLPFYPGCANIRIEGTIVRRRGRRALEPALSSPPVR